MEKLKLVDYQDEGWPFPAMSANELTLTNCPNLVLPAAFLSRDTIIIDDGEVKVTIVFDGSVLILVTGANIPHSVAQQMVGKSLGDLIDIPNLSHHPIASRIMRTIDVLDDGVDIELED